MKKKAELRVRNTQHDRLQMESTHIFDLEPINPDEVQRRYEIDMYMFISTSVGINKSNFSSSNFFKYFTSYFRIRTPKIKEWRTLEPETFRIDALDDYLDVHLETFARRELTGRVVQELKLWGNLVHTQLKSLYNKCRKRGASSEAQEDLERIHRLIWAFRERYVRPINRQALLLETDVRRALRLTDEYISYRQEMLYIKIQKVIPEWSERLDEFLRQEIEYRQETQIINLDQGEDKSKAFEAYTYRLGLLKKYLAEVLYLKAVSAKRDHLYRNGVAAIGAGLAATFAGWAEHNRIQYLTGNDSGVRLTVLIGIAVAAYVFKDRIKDLSKEYFNNRLKRLLPDRRWAIQYPYYRRSGKKDVADLGFVHEYARYLKDIPDEIKYLRRIEKRRDLDPKRREEVLHVSRRFDFELSEPFLNNDIRYLKNVVRINFSSFLARLDNPKKTVNYYSEEGIQMATAAKVYHINILFRYQTIFGGGEATQKIRTDYERIRVVLNKNGIVRIEPVVRGGELAYVDEVAS